MCGARVNAFCSCCHPALQQAAFTPCFQALESAEQESTLFAAAAVGQSRCKMLSHFLLLAVAMCALSDHAYKENKWCILCFHDHHIHVSYLFNLTAATKVEAERNKRLLLLYMRWIEEHAQSNLPSSIWSCLNKYNLPQHMHKRLIRLIRLLSSGLLPYTARFWRGSTGLAGVNCLARHALSLVPFSDPSMPTLNVCKYFIHQELVKVGELQVLSWPQVTQKWPTAPPWDQLFDPKNILL
eukprot:1156850-Pelagomonas_calceolata.AAC.14